MVGFDKQMVLSLLQELERLDPKRRVFGALGHRYNLNPPLPVEAIREFEAQHALVLPEDYKYFLLEIANNTESGGSQDNELSATKKRIR